MAPEPKMTIRHPQASNSRVAMHIMQQTYVRSVDEHTHNERLSGRAGSPCERRLVWLVGLSSP